MQHLLAKKPISFVLVLLLTMLLAVWSIGDVAQGANLTVTKTDDTNDGVCNADCSIREAIGDAAAGDTIDIPSGTYTLTLGSAISINKDLILIGAGPEGYNHSGCDRAWCGNILCTYDWCFKCDGFRSNYTVWQ